MRYTLAAGDVLYLPRGTIHAPETEAAPSVHLTVGLDSDFTWADYFKGLQGGGFVPPDDMQALGRCRCFRKQSKDSFSNLMLLSACAS